MQIQTKNHFLDIAEIKKNVNHCHGKLLYFIFIYNTIKSHYILKVIHEEISFPPWFMKKEVSMFLYCTYLYVSYSFIVYKCFISVDTSPTRMICMAEIS